jgi:hypothetical protein
MGSVYLMRYEVLKRFGPMISRAYAIMGEKSGESKREELTREKVNEIVQDLKEGVINSDPLIATIKPIIENFLGYELDADTLIALTRHPFVKQLINQFISSTPSQPSQQQQNQGGIKVEWGKFRG